MTTLSTKIEQLIDAADWSGWEWAQDFHDPASNDRVCLEGPGELQFETDTGTAPALLHHEWDAWQEEIATKYGEAVAAAARAYGEECQRSAAAATASALLALELVENCDLDGALDAARDAALEEREYGDAPTWGPLVALLEAALEG